MSAQGNPEKGARYLGLLDQALCNGDWAEVGELARKVDKHAPSRKCLTLAVRAEAQVAAASHRPTSASSVTATSIHSLGEFVPHLADLVGSSRESNPDDAYVAGVCLAEIHWLQEAPQDALQVLADVVSPLANTNGSPGALGWIEVCAVKASFIKASCLDICGQKSEAIQCYQIAVRQTPGYRSPELRRWTERLLAYACMFDINDNSTSTLQDLGQSYRAFRAWSDFWQRASSAIGRESATTRLDIPRRRVWRAFYDLISAVLQRGLFYNPVSGADDPILEEHQVSAEQVLMVKRRQRAELQQVEATYESILLDETQFPKAVQSNTEVEEWIEQVMNNWRTFSSFQWTDLDLGEGGKRAISQVVLDILYRAATKTFHSTPILRHLFTIHAANGEFDLAIHAFTSYAEIIDRGKARAEKTGKHETGFDDDDTAMLTAAEAIRVLCRYGDLEQSKKATEVAELMQKWLGQQRPSTEDELETDQVVVNGEFSPLASRQDVPSLKSSTLAATHRALGISQARWAQLTYASETRSTLLADASNHLRRAQQLDSASIETAHALAFVLAETRDVSGALAVIRASLEAENLDDDAGSSLAFEQLRHQIPMWHLLALCLTAKDEYEVAVRMCEAAYKGLDRFESRFGQPRGPISKDPEKVIQSSNQSAFDQLESFEKESLLQIKMTELILFELTEGPDEAVDLTDELLGLYSSLFGNPEHVAAEITAKPPTTAVSHTPSRLAGTLKSITGSIRPRSTRSTRGSIIDKDAARQRSIISEEENTPMPSSPGSNGQALGPPIAITITNEEGLDSVERPHHRSHLPHPHLFKGRRIRSKSLTRNTTGTDKEKIGQATENVTVSNSTNPTQLLGDIAHNAPHDSMPPPPGHEDQPPQQDVRLPAPHPTTASVLPERRLSSAHERRHKVAVLVNTWLFTAELYIRAETYDDAENLIHDAVKLTESLELELARSDDGTNVQRLYFRAWGCGKSIDELWADVWTTKARLAAAQNRPYEEMAAYEHALSHHPDHGASIIGLSALLLDIFEEKLAAEEPAETVQPSPSASALLIKEVKEPRPSLTRPSTATALPSRRTSFAVAPEPMEAETSQRKVDPSPEELNRLAARDRAYMLLSNLTKQGAGWDDSEAWLTLARAHELSHEIAKAKSALWWVVELENNRPIRPWKTASPGGYTL